MGKFTQSKATSEDRWIRWQRSAMLAEEAITRLDCTQGNMKSVLERECQLTAAYNDLYLRMVRASRLMIYKGRQMIRDHILKTNKRGNLFYSFQGFCHVLKAEKEERLKREHEEQRDAVEFALGNEVKFLLAEQ